MPTTASSTSIPVTIARSGRGTTDVATEPFHNVLKAHASPATRSTGTQAQAGNGTGSTSAKKRSGSNSPRSSSDRHTAGSPEPMSSTASPRQQVPSLAMTSPQMDLLPSSAADELATIDPAGTAVTGAGDAIDPSSLAIGPQASLAVRDDQNGTANSVGPDTPATPATPANTAVDQTKQTADTISAATATSALAQPPAEPAAGSTLLKALGLLRQDATPTAGDPALAATLATARASAMAIKNAAVPAKPEASFTGKSARVAGSTELNPSSSLMTNSIPTTVGQASLLPRAGFGLHSPLHAGATTEATPARAGSAVSEHGTARDSSSPHDGTNGQQDSGTGTGPQTSTSPAPATTAASMPAAGSPAFQIASTSTSAPASTSATPANETRRDASIPASSEAAQPADATTPMSHVQVAKLLHTATGSELRVGVQSDEFGAISIRTALGREQLSAHISLDGDRLGSAALSTHLSSMQDLLAERLGQNLGVRASVSVAAETSSSHGQDAASHGRNGATNSSADARSGQGSSHHAAQQQVYRPGPYVTGSVSGPDLATTSVSTPLPNFPSNTGRLDIRI